MIWSPQHYLESGRQKGRAEEPLQTAIVQTEFLLDRPGNPAPILSLNHLADRSGVHYFFLKCFVERNRVLPTYRHFSIRKQSGGKRTISVPHPKLMRVQRWINSHILQHQCVHRSSFAFRAGKSIVHCAGRHTGARWLVKMDITNFFGSISEIQVYRVFRNIGYQPLVAFEMSRLTTCVSENPWLYKKPQWQSRRRHITISRYLGNQIGHLPQGAPTSPMISNLVMRDLDARIAAIATDCGLTYTRYSDDITLSTRADFSRKQATAVVSQISAILRPVGFYPNRRKTSIVPPGARKVVLGLNVDGAFPRLSREFRDKLRQHIYYIEKFGPIEHMKRRDFDTILGMKSHIRGLIDFANMVDPAYARSMLERFNNIKWPV